MLDEIVEVFATVPPGVVLDATLGGGGHTEAILERRPDLSVVGIDRDRDALAAATRPARSASATASTPSTPGSTTSPDHGHRRDPPPRRSTTA